MIKIHHSDTKMHRLAENHKNRVIKEIKDKISIFKIKKSIYTPVYEYVENQLDNILEGNPKALQRHIKIINQIIFPILAKDTVWEIYFNSPVSNTYDDWFSEKCLSDDLQHLISHCKLRLSSLNGKTANALKNRIDLLKHKKM